MRWPFVFVLLIGAPLAATAQSSPRSGPLIHSAGAVFEVAAPDFPTPHDIDYAVAFEAVDAAGEPDRVNPVLNSAARFLNMHAQAGVPAERLRVAVVVHGPAGWELLDDAAYRERHGVDNPNSALIRELIEAGTPVVLCGQTAASRGIPRDRLLDGVTVALSAMTAFVVLQEQGYTVNPW